MVIHYVHYICTLYIHSIYCVILHMYVSVWQYLCIYMSLPISLYTIYTIYYIHYHYTRTSYPYTVLYYICMYVSMYLYARAYIVIHHILHTFSLYQRSIFIYCVIPHLYAYVSIYISVPNTLITLYTIYCIHFHYTRGLYSYK